MPRILQPVSPFRRRRGEPQVTDEPIIGNNQTPGAWRSWRRMAVPFLWVAVFYAVIGLLVWLVWP